MAKICPECSAKIRPTEALCDDWQDPNKAFGCPNCKTFLVKSPNTGMQDETKTTIVSAGIFVPAAMLIGQYFRIKDPVTLMLSLIILGAAFMLLFADIWPAKSMLYKSPYQPHHPEDAKESEAR